jgi:hypothetical protein
MAPTPPASRPDSRHAALSSVALGAAIAASVGAGWAVLEGSELAGPLAATAGAGLIVAQLLARPKPSRQLVFLAGLADRVFDGVILAALAWAAWDADPLVAALALVALAVSFFATYVRARGSTLEYPVEESPVNRGIRYALVAAIVWLGSGWTEAALWTLVVFVTLTWFVRLTQVVKGERAS